MSHALGDAKRFVPRLDRSVYRVEDQVTFTVEAYDANYEPLSGTELPGGGLAAEWTAPSADGTTPEPIAVTIAPLRRGVFETRFPVYVPGEYTIRVQDPVTGSSEERRLSVVDSSAERLRAVRDVSLQEQLARQTGGRSYDLTNVARLADDLRLKPVVEHSTRDHPLWDTPLWFTLVVGLMVSEWLARRWIGLQ
jgi:hypothetical protein